MLADAGVTNLKMKIWAMPVSRPYNPNGRRIAEMIQADLAKVGVTADIYTLEWGEYLKPSADKNRDGAVEFGWTGDNGDPDNFLATLLGCDAVGGANRANWCNQDFQALDPEGRDHQQHRRSHGALSAGAADLQGSGAVADHRPHDRQRAGAEEGDRLQDRPARPFQLRRRRHQRKRPQCRRLAKDWHAACARARQRRCCSGPREAR